MNAVSLFSGIGGIDLAFSWAGFDIQAQVEIDKYCQQVLAKHAAQYWPNAFILEDVNHAGRHNLPANPDVAFGGFPCTDISNAGKRQGIKEDTQSGLWIQFARIIGEIRPRIVLLENVAAITSRDGTRVIADLTAMGYDAQWGIIPASAVGAPHRRERWFCVAYDNQQRRRRVLEGWRQSLPERRDGMAHDNGVGLQRRQDDFTASSLEWQSGVPAKWSENSSGLGRGSEALAHADAPGRRQEFTSDKGYAAERSSQLAYSSPSIEADQPSGVDREALGSTIARTGSGIVGGDTAERILVSERTVTCGNTYVGDSGSIGRGSARVQHDSESQSAEGSQGHLAHATGAGLSQPRQSEFSALETKNAAGLVIQSERRSTELAHPQSIVARHGHNGAQPLLGSAHEENEDVRRRAVESIMGRAVDGLSRQLDIANRLSHQLGVDKWPARPGQPQYRWEAPRTVRKLPGRASRLKALGNAVVPAVVFPIAAAIYAFLEEEDRQAGEGDVIEAQAQIVGMTTGELS